MRCYLHRQPRVTLLGRGQEQIQVSMGGGRDQRFISSAFAPRPSRSVEEATCGWARRAALSPRFGNLLKLSAMPLSAHESQKA